MSGTTPSWRPQLRTAITVARFIPLQALAAASTRSMSLLSMRSVATPFFLATAARNRSGAQLMPAAPMKNVWDGVVMLLNKKMERGPCCEIGRVYNRHTGGMLIRFSSGEKEMKAAQILTVLSLYCGIFELRFYAAIRKDVLDAKENDKRCIDLAFSFSVDPQKLQTSYSCAEEEESNFFPMAAICDIRKMWFDDRSGNLLPVLQAADIFNNRGFVDIKCEAAFIHGHKYTSSTFSEYLAELEAFPPSELILGLSWFSIDLAVLDTLLGRSIRKLALFDPLQKANYVTDTVLQKLVSTSQHLQEFTITGRMGLDNLTPLAKLTNLVKLSLGKSQITNDAFDSIADALAGTLTELDLSFPTRLKRFDSLRKLRQLVVLNVAASDIDAEGIAAIAELPLLENLNLNNCLGVTDFTLLRRRTSLKVLSLKCTNIDDTDLEAISDLRGLVELNLSSCRKLRQFYPLVRMRETLWTLQVAETAIDNKGLSEICAPPAPVNGKKRISSQEWDSSDDDGFVVEGLTSLRNFQLTSCVNVTDFTPLKNLIYLKQLMVSHTLFDDATGVPAVLGLPLRELHCRNCEQVGDWGPLKEKMGVRLFN